MADDSTTTAAAETVSKADFDKMEARAKLFEAKTVDFEKKFKGIDPDDVARIKLELDETKKKGALGDETKINEYLKTKETEIGNRYSEKLTEKEKSEAALLGELKELRVVGPAMQKAAEVFNSDALELIGSVVKRDCEWTDGRIVVKGADGKPMPSKLDPRKDMDLDEYMNILADKYPSCAKATGTAGSKDTGTKAGSNGAGRSYTIAQLQAMPPAQAQDIMNKMSPEEASKVLSGK